jgi:hypothetical protein
VSELPLRRMHPAPCADCSPLLVYDLTPPGRRCERCDVLLDPATYAGHAYARRFCSVRCRRSAARLRWIAAHPKPPGQRTLMDLWRERR